MRKRGPHGNVEAMATFLDRIKKMMSNPTTLPPAARLVGFRVLEAKVGSVTLELQAGERHHNAVGTLHGGILCDVSDAAMGLSYASTLVEGESFTTVEGLTEADVLDAEGKLVARASSTCMTLRGDQAAGR